VMEPALLDTDTLSEVMKGQDAQVQDHARQYLATFGTFTFSLMTRYEVLRGLKVRNAVRQLARFEQQCRRSHVLPLTDAIIVRAAEIYALLSQRGQLISDATSSLQRQPCTTTSSWSPRTGTIFSGFPASWSRVGVSNGTDAASAAVCQSPFTWVSPCASRRSSP